MARQPGGNPAGLSFGLTTGEPIQIRPTGDAIMLQVLEYKVGRISHSAIRTNELQPSYNGEHFEVTLTEGLEVCIHGRGGEPDETHRIPPGFKFDGASVRYRWANGVMLRWGRRSTPAAALHDWYYSDGRHLIPVQGSDRQRRLWADRLFLRALLAAGVNPVRARLAYRAVRLFGGGVWKNGTGKGNTA